MPEILSAMPKPSAFSPPSGNDINARPT